MGRFVKKPVVVEAWQYQGGDGDETVAYPGWFTSALGLTVLPYDDHLIIRTLEGEHRAEPGDWIIQGIKGELYPCKPDIFEATYTVVS